MSTYVSASEAGRLLGVSPSTVLRWIEEGKFPNSYRVESTVRIPESDIESLKANKKGA